ncbi:MAG: CBS domain-containing protein [Desulfobacterales bacterium]|nr:CBS domain-containing protein [Desulfobacterales bacterium]MCP4160942.1 CBS domain-containing protein [Deltaproteobacteria bacterium]
MGKQKKNKKISVITTHINADFDAIASMFAAQKLYPDASVVFPGSNEKNLRNFFISSVAYMYNLQNIDEIDAKNVNKLIIVDTKNRNRIGKASEILKNKDLTVHIYDHHPERKDDIKGDLEETRLVGATITILTQKIKEKKIEITPEEATIMCLGIYEDTGSFTFPSTTEEDFLAASYLLSKGANLDTISSLISKEINPQGIALLNDMIQSAVVHNINGLEVVTTNVTTSNYVHNLASLVVKMARMESIDTLFVLVRVDNKIFFIARNKIPEIDVGEIATDLGGGGHTDAAAATIKDKTLAQAEQLLLASLHRRVKQVQVAKKVMSFPAVTINQDTTCKETSSLLTKYNINSAPVVSKENKICGYISRRIIEKALYHKLENIKIKEYMNTEFETVSFNAKLTDIQEIVFENKQSLVPVIEKGKIEGVITKTDILDHLMLKNGKTKFASPLKKSVLTRTRNINRFIEERLSTEIIELLTDIGEVAYNMGFSSYVVGGFVRDLMLYRDNDDIDIVIEGNGINFAKKYARLNGARVNTYEKFGTAVIVLTNGFKIDVASARTEFYKFPAALPTVEMSSIKLDLFRRDFTINTLAINLNPGNFGTLIDFFAAQKDLKDKSIRIIHNMSFVEDPTRVFRAIRFEQRFGFKIGKLTANLIENAVKMDFFKDLSGPRVLSEIKTLLEENSVSTVTRLFDYNLTKIIHPKIRKSKKLFELLDSVEKVTAWHELLFLDAPCMKWVIPFMLLIDKCTWSESKDICKKFKIPPKHEKLIVNERFKTYETMLYLENNLNIENSNLYKKLTGFSTETILFMMAVTENESVKRLISFYYNKLRQVKVKIRGLDIQNLGIKPGPLFKDIMQDVLYAQLDGKLKTREDELRFIKKYV